MDAGGGITAGAAAHLDCYPDRTVPRDCVPFSQTLAYIERHVLRAWTQRVRAGKFLGGRAAPLQGPAKADAVHCRLHAMLASGAFWAVVLGSRK
ncbi:hypothetical protein SBBP2_1400010 [Burkholderiales bacterium]|jgi:hypothetical protein|nr:hypothetical protein SBBP2_1400010 [Burkholderiales bacterium]